CRLLTGQGGLQNEIKWVNILEILDDLSHIEPGEFLITTAHGFNTESESQQQGMIELFAARKLAAVAIQTGHYLQEIPASFIRFSEEYKIPLIEIPPEVSFKSLTRALMNEVISNEQQAAFHASAAEKATRPEPELTAMKALWNRLIKSENPDSFALELNSFNLNIDEPIITLCVAINSTENIKTYISQTELNDQAYDLLESNVVRILREYQLPFLLGPLSSCLQLVVQTAKPRNVTSRRETFDAEAFIKDFLYEHLLQHISGQQMTIHSGCSQRYFNKFKLTLGEAGKALRAAQLGLPDKASLVFFRSLGIYSLIMEINDHEVIESFFKDSVAPLRRYDQRTNGSLLLTLETYLNHCSIKKAAE
ncbi:MAG: PucR family transcriptional regulator ligand-binding domain-containing protein, partial [Dethiobacteria bacterium]|nr:PucR family transcriptional regulator ligand-binding domain-containing protein [Dethiobacteria bacterium]